MEQFIVSARKYRPADFEEVVGQEHITSTLDNAIANNHLAQALLFCGPRGVGKTTCARILAKKINQADNAEITDYSLNVFELDAASNNSVDDIRNLIDQVRFAPQTGNYKVYIIDEVHMLSQAAFNAFLKTLEEPPAHAIFILATTEKHKIIPTILSRCQIFDFKRISVDDIAGHLAHVAQKEGIEAEPEALHMIAQKADGALRDSLSIFDRISSFSGSKITYQDVIENLNILDYEYYFRSVDTALQNDLHGLLILLNEILERGFDPHLYLNGLASHLRDLLVAKDPQTVQLLQVPESVKKRYVEQSAGAGLGWLAHGLKTLNDADVRFKTSNNQRLLTEIALIQLLQLPQEAPLPEKKNDVSTAPEPPQRPHPPKGENTETPSPAEAPTAQKSEPEPKSYREERVKPKQAEETESPIPERETATPPAPKPAPAQAKINKPIMAGLPSLSRNKQEKEKAKKASEEAESEVKKDQPRQEVTQMRFDDIWKNYLPSLESRPAIHSLLTTIQPVLENEKIKISLANNTQKNSLDEIRQDLLDHLRNALQNYYLDFEIDYSSENLQDRPYTAAEKFEALRKKYPLVDDLKKKLDLDFT